MRFKPFVLAKVTSLMMIGTLYGQAPKVVEFAHAIAQAEGFYVKGSIPNRCFNPGDLKGRAFPGEIGLCKGGHARFRNNAAGWAALYHQVEKMGGSSTQYTAGMTFGQVAKRYAENYRPWLKIVTKRLQISASDDVSAFLQTDMAEDDNELWPFGSTQVFSLSPVSLMPAPVY
jgi:hypothetical protein